MKEVNIYLSNEKIKKDQTISAKQVKYLASLIGAHDVSNPFTSAQDVKERLSKYEARKAIQYIRANYKIIWVTPEK